jgi:peptide/nickel transport system permease protein
MTAYLIRRLWQTIPTLIGVILLVFFLFKYFGGDPAEILGGLNASPEQINAIREQLGLNEPVWVQLGIFFKQILTFDWGRSWATNEAVSNLFATRLGPTLTVMVPILIFEVLLAIPFALLVAYWRGSLTDRTIMVITTVALVPGAGLERQPVDQPGRVCAAAGAAGRDGESCAADAAVPHLLSR